MLAWDRELVASGLDEIATCRASLLLALKALLDEYHGWAKPVSYYDLLAGDWLESFTHVVFAMRRELEAGGEPGSEVPIRVAADLVAFGASTWHDSTLHDQLRRAIGVLLEGTSAVNIRFSEAPMHVGNTGGSGVAKRLTAAIATSRPEVMLVSPEFKCSRTEFFGALWKWRDWLAWDEPRELIDAPEKIDKAWRIQHAMSQWQAPDLASMVQALMPLFIPIALLEGFVKLRTVAMSRSIHRPKVVYSANAVHGNLMFKIQVAEWRSQGTRLMYHQHGGGYGIDRTHTIELYETRVCDKYLTWGWTNELDKVVPLSPAFPHVPSRLRKHILLSCCNFPQYPFRLHFHPMPGTIQTMHVETRAFLATLPDRRDLLVRPYPSDYGWGAVEMMRQTAPNVQFDDRRRSAFERYAESRLVVHNYLGTGYLETIGLNIPTLCFYDTDTYSFRTGAQGMMDNLESVGILHRSGKAAADFLASLGGDVEGWWQQAEVQNVRAAFAARYANFSKNWRSEWEDAFQAEIAIAS